MNFAELYETLVASLGAAFVLLCFVALILFAVFVIAMWWNIFKKAWLRGWRVLIPILNVYTVFKVADKKGSFWIALLLSVASSVLSALNLGYVVTGLFTIVLGICWIILEFSVAFSLAELVGYGKWFGVGLVLLPIVFLPILAFGRSEYMG